MATQMPVLWHHLQRSTAHATDYADDANDADARYDAANVADAATDAAHDAHGKNAAATATDDGIHDATALWQ